MIVADFRKKQSISGDKKTFWNLKILCYLNLLTFPLENLRTLLLSNKKNNFNMFFVTDLKFHVIWDIFHNRSQSAKAISRHFLYSCKWRKRDISASYITWCIWQFFSSYMHNHDKQLSESFTSDPNDPSLKTHRDAIQRKTVPDNCWLSVRNADWDVEWDLILKTTSSLL